MLYCAAAFALATPVLAQQAVPGPLLGNGAVIKGPSLDLAAEAAQAAIKTCAAMNYQIGVAVVDDTGGIRLVMGADGARAADSNGARRAAAFAAVEKEPGAALLERVKTDKALEQVFMANYANYQIREGALLLKAGGKVVGAIAVEGHPHDAKKDIACAQAGIDKIQARLK
jgi:uncharacterized protein GlcG (DUF336 family)